MLCTGKVQKVTDRIFAIGTKCYFVADTKAYSIIIAECPVNTYCRLEAPLSTVNYGSGVGDLHPIEDVLKDGVGRLAIMRGEGVTEVAPIVQSYETQDTKNGTYSDTKSRTGSVDKNHICQGWLETNSGDYATISDGSDPNKKCSINLNDNVGRRILHVCKNQSVCKFQAAVAISPPNIPVVLGNVRHIRKMTFCEGNVVCPR